MFEYAIEILELVDEQIAQGVSLITIKARIINGDVPPDPDPEPEPTTKMFEVTIAKTNARYAWKYNGAGRPIMQIYPEDNAPVRDRVQFVYSTKIKVKPEIVKSDGGTPYYAIAEQVYKSGVLVTEQLYLKAEDGRIV
jgi:hypothetical protein